MFNIGQYFDRFLNSQNKEVVFRTVVKKIVLEKVGIDLNVGDISIKSGVINLKNISQAARSAIFIKKQLLISTINESQGSYKVIDIR